MDKLLKDSIIEAKAMIKLLDDGKSVPATKFLPIYNRITGRREQNSCPGCWAPRVALLKKKIELIEKEEGELVPEVEKPKAEEDEKPPKKKKRGRPPKKKD